MGIFRSGWKVFVVSFRKYNVPWSTNTLWGSRLWTLDSRDTEEVEIWNWKWPPTNLIIGVGARDVLCVGFLFRLVVFVVAVLIRLANTGWSRMGGSRFATATRSPHCCYTLLQGATLLLHTATSHTAKLLQGATLASTVSPLSSEHPKPDKVLWS